MRDKLIKLIREAFQPCEMYRAMLIADHLIANDVVHVVRCKDCIYFWNDEEMYPNHCSKHGVLLKVYKDDFCSYGERKDNA